MNVYLMTRFEFPEDAMIRNAYSSKWMWSNAAIAHCPIWRIEPCTTIPNADLTRHQFIRPWFWWWWKCVDTGRVLLLSGLTFCWLKQIDRTSDYYDRPWINGNYDVRPLLPLPRYAHALAISVAWTSWCTANRFRVFLLSLRRSFSFKSRNFVANCHLPISKYKVAAW